MEAVIISTVHFTHTKETSHMDDALYPRSLAARANVLDVALVVGWLGSVGNALVVASSRPSSLVCVPASASISDRAIDGVAAGKNRFVGRGVGRRCLGSG